MKPGNVNNGVTIKRNAFVQVSLSRPLIVLAGGGSSATGSVAGAVPSTAASPSVIMRLSENPILPTPGNLMAGGYRSMPAVKPSRLNSIPSSSPARIPA